MPTRWSPLPPSSARRCAAKGFAPHFDKRGANRYDGWMIDRFLEGLTALNDYPGDIYTPILIPGDFDPHERHYRWGLHIDAELRMTGLGSAGGGWQIQTGEDEDGDWEIAYSIIDADVTELDRGLALIRLHLAELGCPAGTLLQYGDREDRWDGERWHLGEGRTIYEDDQEPWQGDE